MFNGLLREQGARCDLRRTVPQHPTKPIRLDHVDLGAHLALRVAEVLEPGTDDNVSCQPFDPVPKGVIDHGPG